MNKFSESQKRFKAIDGANFGICLDQIQHGNKLIEWRMREKDNRVCIIQYWTDGAGYVIYEEEKL